MTTAIMIFMTVATVVLVISFAVVSARNVEQYRQYETDSQVSESRINELIAEKDLLLAEYATLAEKNAELYSDNVKLADAVRELREINKALTAEPTETEPEEEPKLLPDGHTNTYRCEDYRLFRQDSDQWRLQRECYTSEYTGIRIYHTNGTKYLCAAMATAYGTQIGRAYRITLRNGNIYNIIVGDFKHPIDNVQPDDYGDPDVNYDGQPTTSVIEFIVDMDAVPDEVKKAGTMSALDEFGGLFGDGGDIVEIVPLGSVWYPMRNTESEG